VDAALSNTPPATTVARLSAAGGLILISAGSAVVWFFDPARSGFFPVCPLYAMTGFACPGCGLTRGFHALFHGDIVTALDYNALIPLFALAFVLLIASLVSLAVRGKGLVKLSASPPFLVGTLILLLTFGVLRNLPFYPFTLLYP
jgi:hypothetical protein